MAGNFVVQFSWGLVIVAAFIGWGRVAHGALGREASDGPDWGLLAGWGMAASLIAGGLLAALGWVSASLLMALVIIGAVLAVPTIGQAAKDMTPKRWLLAILVAVPVLLHYAAAVHFHSTSCADDEIAYFPLIERLLQTGTLIDPFSMRRMGGYGGQTFLQALVAVTGNEDNAFLMDRGIAFIVSFGLIAGYFKRGQSGGYLIDPARAAIVFTIITLVPFPLLNSASHVTGLAMFLTLFRTLERVPAPAQASTRMLWLIAGIVAATASLRAHYLLIGPAAVAAYSFLHWLGDRRRIKAHVVSLVHVGVASAVFLVPWMELLYRSSGTFLYPLMRGNHQPSFENYSASLGIGEHLSFVADILLEPRMLVIMVPLAMLAWYRHSRAALSLCLAAVTGMVVTTWIFTLSDIDNIHRYVAPVMNAALIATVIAFVHPQRQRRDGEKSVAIGNTTAIVCVGVVMAVFAPAIIIRDTNSIIRHWDYRDLPEAKREQYIRMQASVPEGEKILTMVYHPFAFDYLRNEIFNIDVPGAASPDPGIPYFKGEVAFEAYLAKQEVGFIAFGNFDDPTGCLYNRPLWEFHRDGEVQAWRMGAAYYLDVMDNMEALAQNRDVVFSEGGFRVIRLDR